MSNFHYLVKAKIILSEDFNSEMEFLEFEKEFKHENPIIARKEAFEYYQKNIEFLLETKHKKYYSDQQARTELSHFKDLDESLEFDEDVDLSKIFRNGIGVFLYHDEEEDFIHGIGDRWFSTYNPDQLMYNLEIEANLYKENNLPTGNYLTNVLFCSCDEWLEGYLGNGKWVDESYMEPQVRQILHTPFDWSNYSEPYWWDKDENQEKTDLPRRIEQILANGESNQVEFKPALMYNFSTNKGGIGVKGFNAKAICALLNSNGGVLVIGADDNGVPQGLDPDFSLSQGKKAKDFFLLEFDSLLKHFFSFSVKSDVSGKFYKINDKDIFIVTVSPSRRRPIFMNGQNSKEFYVRGEASSRLITDPEELVNYCLDKWGNKNYQ